MPNRLLTLALLAVLSLSACTTREGKPAASVRPENVPPPLEREFRGVWVATVGNIDWPTKPGLPVERQKADLIKILDRAVELKLNAIIFQVRPACDAIYASKIEPWASWLTGEMGKAPEPYYDPLDFIIAEAHKRNLELHAWFNPYRALLKGKSKSPVAANHVSKLHPEFVVDYGTHLWLDPTDEGARQYSLSVIQDVVKRYDVDGVQFDDYFYPYSENDKNKKPIPFPDDKNWAKYTAQGGTLSRADWRRENVNKLIQAVGRMVKQEKPWVQFGISPFGVWKDGAPCPAKCDSYNDLFADARKWMQEGWVDYMSPQLYWKTDYPGRPYSSLLKWWADQNKLGRHLWPGLYDSQIGQKEKKTGTVLMTLEDIVKQCEMTRSQPGASGNIHFSMAALMKNQGGMNAAMVKLYDKPALAPASPWLSKEIPARPRVKVSARGNDLQLNWQPGNRNIGQWALQKRTGADWVTELIPASQSSVVVKAGADGSLPQAIALTAIDRYGNASQPSIFQR